MTRLVRIISLAALTSALAACGGEETCFTQRDCASGFRCELERAGEEGICVQCGGSETPYNGQDDDCDPTSRDIDLDGDGDNAATSEFAPGGDCDDNDPTVNSKLAEVCSDGKDNNCNSDIDEPECADLEVPQVRIEMPTANSAVSGTVRFTVFADDDYQVERVELVSGANRYTEVSSSGNDHYFDVDTTQLVPDGPYSFQATAFDTQERSASDAVTVRVDNFSPPEIEIDSPMPNGAYAGNLFITLRASDGSGIARIEARIDSNVVAETTTEEMLDVQVDTSSLAEGLHTFEVRVEDRAGNTGMDSFTILIDRTGPNISFSPLPGTQLEGLALVTVTASDAAGIREVQCEGLTGPSPLDCVIDTLFLPNGPYTVTATVYDATVIDGVQTGNQGVARATFDVYNDANRPPVLRFVDPADGDGVYRHTLITVEAFSPNGLDRVELYIDGELSATQSTGAPYQFPWDFSRATGTVELELIAYDTAANQSSTTATVLVVPPPKLRLASEVRVPAGGTTRNYLIQDLNGDQYPDLLLTTPALELHPGTMTPQVFDAAVPIGPAAVDVRALDLDADTDLDLIVFTGAGIALYFNDGPNTYSAGPVYTPSLSSLSAFDVGDLDADGRADVVFAHANAGLADFVVMKQTASGSFVQSGLFGLVGEVTSIQIGAADGDADLDVLVSRIRSSFVSVFLNGGTGNFGAGQDSPTQGRPRYARLADVTGDNYPDIVATAERQEYPGMEVLTGSPANVGQFTSTQYITTLDTPNGFALGDWTGDNLLDLVFTMPVGNQIQVHENVGGVFDEKRNYAVARDIMRPSIVDFDRDGDPDIVMQSPTRTALAFVENRGVTPANWRFGAAPVIPIDFVQNIRTCPYGPYDPDRLPGALAVGQLIGSPLVDLVFAVDGVICNDNPADPSEEVPPIPPALLVLENQNLGAFVTVGQTDLPDEMDPSNLAIGDLDGQLGPDIGVGTEKVLDLMGDPILATAALLLNDGPASYSVRSLFIDEPEAVVIGDVNGDGEGEAVFSKRGNPLSHGLVVYPAVGAPLYTNSVGLGASSVVIGNLDADPDGYLDMAVANSLSDNVSVHAWNEAQGSWRRSIYNTNASISALTAALLPGDTRPDLIGVGSSGVIVLESDASFGFRTPTAWDGGTPSAPYRINTGDFNRDGLLDVVVLNASLDAVALLVGRPQGGFFRPDPIPVTRGPQALGLGQIWEAVDDLVLVNNVVPGVVFILNETD